MRSGKYYILFLMSGLVLSPACKPTPKEPDSAQKNTDGSGRPTDDIGGVPGYSLVCGYEYINNKAGAIGCNYQNDATRQSADFTTLGGTPSWSFVNPYDSFKITTGKSSNGWQTLYAISGVLDKFVTELYPYKVLLKILAPGGKTLSTIQAPLGASLRKSVTKPISLKADALMKQTWIGCIISSEIQTRKTEADPVITEVFYRQNRWSFVNVTANELTVNLHAVGYFTDPYCKNQLTQAAASRRPNDHLAPFEETAPLNIKNVVFSPDGKELNWSVLDDGDPRKMHWVISEDLALVVITTLYLTDNKRTVEIYRRIQ
ncbi:MAG: hypothetical protein HQK54_05170 [Oligoflexales bacterium]|nr:hypothetical protein [Oligoflexales bacterium]